MQLRDRPRMASWVFAVTLALCLAIAVVVLVRAATQTGGFRSGGVESMAVPLLAILLVATLVSLWAWWHETRAARRLLEAEARGRADAERGLASAAQAIEAARDDARGEVERTRAEAEEERERHGEELRATQDRLARIERARQAEKAWAAELRAQVVELHRRASVLSTGGDVRELVLRIATELLEAQKGVLFEREGDGLSVACHVGFEHDPTDSALAHRLADHVIAHDETLREDDRADIDAASRTPADEEISNLVAIPVYVADEFSGAVVCANREGGFAELEDDVLLSLGDHAGALLDQRRLQGQLRNAYLATVSVLAGALEAKDPFLRGHSDDVARYVSAVAAKVGVDPDRREELVFGSLLHDVGKLAISERILLKPGALTDEEYAIVQQHPRIGFRLIEQVPALRGIAPAVLHHHERFDGNGYPNGLRGEDIPLEARIVCVADCFSAMTGERTYRDPLTPEEACEELIRGAGTQFDPDIVRVFVEEVRRSGGPGEARSPLEDPELRALRHDGEPLLGSGAIAVTDSLTMLYSHRYLQDAAIAEAQRAALQGRGFSVLVGELTALDEINVTEGFAAGDRALRAAAAGFERASAGAPGTVAARLSGRRLALLVPDDGDDAERRLREELEDGPAVRLGRASWRTGDRGPDVVRRARLAARTGSAPPDNVAAAVASAPAPALGAPTEPHSVWRRWRSSR